MCFIDHRQILYPNGLSQETERFRPCSRSVAYQPCDQTVIRRLPAQLGPLPAPPTPSGRLFPSRNPRPRPRIWGLRPGSDRRAFGTVNPVSERPSRSGPRIHFRWHIPFPFGRRSARRTLIDVRQPPITHIERPQEARVRSQSRQSGTRAPIAGHPPVPGSSSSGTSSTEPRPSRSLRSRGIRVIEVHPRLVMEHQRRPQGQGRHPIRHSRSQQRVDQVEERLRQLSIQVRDARELAHREQEQLLIQIRETQARLDMETRENRRCRLRQGSRERFERGRRERYGQDRRRHVEVHQGQANGLENHGGRVVAEDNRDGRAQHVRSRHSATWSNPWTTERGYRRRNPYADERIIYDDEPRSRFRRWI